MRLKFCAFACCVLSLRLFAADHYIRAGATGSGDGSTWTDAWTDLPSTFVRGDTYYIAAGTYGTHVFDTANSGTTPITLKKATAGDHGTETGWVSTYGDGQAHFTGSAGVIWEFRSSYWIIDGVVGSGTSGHGIKVSSTNTANNTYVIGLLYGQTVTNLTLEHVEVQHSGIGLGAPGALRAFYCNATSSDLTFRYCYMHDANAVILSLDYGPQNVLVEHCYFKNCGSGDAAQHSIAIKVGGRHADHNFVFRYNTVEMVLQVGGTGYLGLGYDPPLNGATESGGYEVYGNVFWGGTNAAEGPGSGVILDTGSDNTFDVKIYNNTIVGMRGAAGINFSASTGDKFAYNNIWYGNTGTQAFINVTHDYNASDDDLSETNDQLLSSDPFTDSASGDFSLVAATTAGTTLASPYDTDATAVTRGADGVWDRGALEYGVPSPLVADIAADDATPEVGQLVTFKCTGTTYSGEADDLNKARYEYDFGDGYVFKFGSPVATDSHSGIAVSHFFMTPGTYTVTVTCSVWDAWNNDGTPVGTAAYTDTDTVEITVSGTAPATGFALYHAPLENRTAQYVYAQIPAAYRAGAHQLRVKVIKPDTSEVLVVDDRSNLAAEESFLLDQSALGTGVHVLQAQILDAGDSQVTGGIWRDLWTRGTDVVAINENNAFVVGGALFFPVGPFLQDPTDLATWVADAGANVAFNEGYYDTHSITSWLDYIDVANTNGLLATGPGRGTYTVPLGSNTTQRWYFNSDVDDMASYAATAGGETGLFAWTWKDEPNLGGRAQKVYMPTLAAWASVTNGGDRGHPHYALYAGLDWSSYYGSSPTVYDYLGSAAKMGGKPYALQAFAFDVYPTAYPTHVALNHATKGPMEMYLTLLDNTQTWNKGLLPTLPCILPCQRNAGEPEPSAEQVYGDSWLNVIHGAKGIIWFPFFQYSTTKWAAMDDFTTDVQALKDVVLSAVPATTCSDNSNASLNRVDTMVRHSGSTVYVFAARVTEPPAITGSLFTGEEPTTVTTQFTVSGRSGTETVSVINESRTLTATDGVFSDDFAKYGVHIYAFEAGPSPDAPTSPTATATSATSITVGWTDNDDDPDETSFRIERSTTSGSGFVEIGTAAANATQYVDDNLTPGTTYYYRIRARNAGGDSAYTSEASDTTDAIAAVSTSSNAGPLMQRR